MQPICLYKRPTHRANFLVIITSFWQFDHVEKEIDIFTLKQLAITKFYSSKNTHS